MREFSIQMNPQTMTQHGKAELYRKHFYLTVARRRRKEGRQRRQRTTFSSDQTLKLEVEFNRNEYISRGRRFELAENLQLSETQIKIWVSLKNQEKLFRKNNFCTSSFKIDGQKTKGLKKRKLISNTGGR